MLFGNVSKERYLEIVSIAKKVNDSEIVKVKDRSIINFKHGRRYTYYNRKPLSNEVYTIVDNCFKGSICEKRLYELNRLIKNNGLFFNAFINDCEQYFGINDTRTLTRMFRHKNAMYNKEWDAIINHLCELFPIENHLLDNLIVMEKIQEMLTYADAYVPSTKEICLKK